MNRYILFLAILFLQFCSTSKQTKNYRENLNDADRKTWSNYMVHRFLSMNMNWVDIVNELQKYKCGFYLDQQNLYESYINFANSLNDEILIEEMSKNAYNLSKKYNSEKLLLKLNKFL